MTGRTEYPRPQFVRETWRSLNGEWEFAFDDADRGLTEKWYAAGGPFAQTIQVPFVYQCALSGIGSSEPHDIVWYRKSVELEEPDAQTDILLHFGAVDYDTKVYVNGCLAGTHTGGCTPFSVNITNYLKAGMQEIVLRVFDPHTDEFIPRGKQFWREKPDAIWYTNSTGIWQTVWLEWVPKKHIENVTYKVRFDEGRVDICCRGARVSAQDMLQYRVFLEGAKIAEGRTAWITETAEASVDVICSQVFHLNIHDEGISWTPEHPVLFDVELSLVEADGNIRDRAASYFGFRKIHTENGMVYLNNKPYYQKLVLDQGYWREGLLTAPEDAAFVRDITLAKDMGFNGCRKHQKAEDPRFLYWADHLGFLVWGESPSPVMYSKATAGQMLCEWREIVERDYNHPCIVAWVPLNESWGVPQIERDRCQQHFALTMYHYLHALDDTRLVVSNDGWQMTETDICAIHNYRHGGKDEPEIYAQYREMLADREELIQCPSTWRSIYVDGYSYRGEPIMLTEFGGIAYDAARCSGWGYTCADTEKEFLEAYRRVIDAVYASKALWGFCYTQLTDVEQEINGLLTYDREPKCDVKKIREINERPHRCCITHNPPS
ncbi:glycoside hydrolase family 2 protein [Marvinbryantia sp.]|uniref:glycoside hydrolase family 2 protein n=1 Tax=Marvinbryantia sp. TaxID=2496532 RepID=UPI002670484F|nr:sugar-binding domain-containing protein [uncultured Marvinbryantia sp.]